MKLKSARIRNFRCIKDLEISFEDPRGRPRFLTCLTGPNGSGKTTVLQAIALALSLATGRTPSVSEFRWKGFMPDRMRSLGDTLIELQVVLDSKEFQELQYSLVVLNKLADDPIPIELPYIHHVSFRLLKPNQIRAGLHKGDREVRVSYPGPKVTFVKEAIKGLARLGRYYANQIVPSKVGDYWKDEDLLSLGDIFWFDQYRLLGSGSAQTIQERALSSAKLGNSWIFPEDMAEVSWEKGVRALRESLINWWTYHTSRRKIGRDLIEELGPKINQIFPGTELVGVEPRWGVAEPTDKDFFFMLERDGKEYDISEMSSGEQAVFEMLYGFVRQRISKSIVLIDELELHLHPPQQQALHRALRHLGEDCQFIITTHSPYLEEVIPSEHQVRLEGGSIAGEPPHR